MIDIEKITAIDVHTHAELSCCQPHDNFRPELDEAFAKYFKTDKRPTMQETADFYREQNMALVMFTIDSEHETGKKRIPNIEVAGCALKNDDTIIAFASIDPHKGRMGAREAKDLIENYGVKGFKFHPTVQGFYPYDKMAYSLYEVIAEYKLPMLFHSGHSGYGSGVRGGGGLRLEYSNPMHLDQVAIDFPDSPIIIAHPSWPWQDEALSVAMHKPNWYIDLSGWSQNIFHRNWCSMPTPCLKTGCCLGQIFH